jgi:hypothetical protein
MGGVMPERRPPLESRSPEPYEMPDVFIGYAHADQKRAAQLKDALAGSGYTIWWDVEVLPGQTWRDVISQHLDAAAVVVVVWSRQAVESDFVHEEAQRALKQKKLVPVTIDGSLPNYGMGQTKIEDLSSWDGKSADDPAFMRVLAGIQQVLKTAPARPSEPTFDVVSRPSRFTFRRIAAGAALAIGLLIAASLFSLLPIGQDDNFPRVEPPPVSRSGQRATPLAARPPDLESRRTVPSGVVAPPAKGNVNALPNACDSLIEVTRKQPDVAAGFAELGKCLYDHGRFSESVSAFDKAAALGDKAPNLTGAQGLANWRRELNAQAMASLDSEIEREPNEASLYERRGELHAANGDFKRAMDDFDKATGLNPRSRRAWLGLAAAAGQNGRPDIATTARTRADVLR